MNNNYYIIHDNLLFGTIYSKIVQHSEARTRLFFKVKSQVQKYRNTEVSVSDFKTRFSQSHKVLDLQSIPLRIYVTIK